MKDSLQHIKNWKNRRRTQKKPIKKFLQFVSKRKNKQLDNKAADLNQKAFSKINCLDCANCCTSIPPIVSRSDVRRLSKATGIKEAEFTRKYLRQDEDDDWVMNTTPCPFLLEDNKCSVYEDRPKACRKYPHTDADEFRNNLGLHAGNAHYCPAVFFILEEMMKVTTQK